MSDQHGSSFARWTILLLLTCGVAHSYDKVIEEKYPHSTQIRSRYSRAMQQADLVQQEMITYQAEEHSNEKDADLKSDETDYTGWGYMDYGNDGYIEWNNVTAFRGSGDYALHIRYSVKGWNDRKCRVYVNDLEDEIATLPFRGTGDYGIWDYENITVPLQGGVNNTVRIEARSRGPHIDKMDVTLVGLYTPAPSPRPTLSDMPSSSPTVSSHPSQSLVPTTSSQPTVETASRPFHLKMFFEEGMKWQETYKRRAWCAECKDKCEKTGIEIEIEECDEKEKYQDWLYEDGRIFSAAKPDMCIECYFPKSSRVRIEKCDPNNDKQRWLGFKTHGKFQLRPMGYPKDCLTQEHHPKSGEHLYLTSCDKSYIGDGTLMDPYDDTSHWEIGRWTGHSDDGEPYRFRPGNTDQTKFRGSP